MTGRTPNGPAGGRDGSHAVVRSAIPSDRRSLGSVVSIHRKGAKWVVRYREGTRNRSRSFDRKADAQRYDAEVRRLQQLGTLASLDAGQETLDEFVTETWAPTVGV